VGRAERMRDGLFARTPLQRRHAVQKPRLEVHDAVGILEVARQRGVRALEDAGATAEVTFLERDVLRPLRLLPECFAFQLEELRRTAFRDHLAVALDLFRGVLGRGARGRSTNGGGRGYK